MNKRFASTDQVVDAVVQYAVKHAADADFGAETVKRQCLRDVKGTIDPALYVYVACRMEFRRGGSFVSKEIVEREAFRYFERAYVDSDKEICLGEVNGKHSEVSATWTQLVDETIDGADDPFGFSLAVAQAGLRDPDDHQGQRVVFYALDRLGYDPDAVNEEKDEDEDEEDEEEDEDDEEKPQEDQKKEEQK